MSQSLSDGNLKKSVVNSAFWIFFGYAVSQGLRLLSSLILSRMLAPEHFGLIALVTVFLIGLGMFTDIGIGPSIIQSDRGFEKEYLNTAWTVQVIRGYVLWLICLIGAYPASLFYNEPQLVWLIPVAGFTTVISGHTSTGIFTNNKKLEIKKQTMYEIVAQLSAIIVMVIVAKVYPSVWALVAGSLFSAILKTTMSHRLDKSVKNRFHWDSAAAKSMVHFGGWILLSTMLGFFVNSGSSLILAKFLTMKELGLFSMGVTLAKVVEGVFNQINSRVVVPTYAHIKTQSLDSIRRKVRKIKVGVMLAFLPPLWILIIFSNQIVGLLFDSRYADTAWILQIFSVSFIPTIITAIDKFYMALGHSYVLARVTLVKALIYFSSLFIGWWLGGGTGMVYGIAASNSCLYFVDSFIQIKYKVWQPGLDLLGFTLSGIVIWLGLMLNHATLGGAF